MKSKPLFLKNSLVERAGPFFCLLAILISSGVLSYSGLSFEPKAWWFLGGVLVPSLWLLRFPDPAGPKRPWRGLEGLGARIWVPLILLGVAIRCSKLAGSHPWPAGDEALQAYFALELVKEWDWQFFYTSGQHPPLLIWLLVPILNFLDPLPVALWLPSALFSCLAFGLAYFTARQFVGKSEAFLFFLLMAFSYWPVISGRWCVQGALVPLFEMGCMLFLGLLLKGGPGTAWKAASLGFCLGLGAWTFTSWLVVVASLAFLVSIWLFQKGRAGRVPLALFWTSLLTAFSPWVFAVFREGFGGYAKGMSMASGFFDWGQQVIVTLSYLTSIFWGPLQGDAGYGALWGGMLNPLLTACFILGIREWYRHRDSGLARWGALLSVFYLLPGLLTADHVEMYRIIQAMPLLLFVTAYGLRSLLGFFPLRGRIPFLAALIAVSLMLDLFHLAQPHLEKGTGPWRWSEVSQDPSHAAYLAFREAEERFGPGLVFTEFLPLARNHTLRVGVYPFNALDHPGLDPAKTRWAGVFVNAHYRPFLESRFPGSQWRVWDQGSPEDGGMVVGILPTHPSTRVELDRWIAAHRHFHRLGVQAENMFNDQKLYRRAVQALPEGYPLMEGDPFLESVYGEWCAQYHYGNGLKGNISVLERALQKGYRAANLHYKLGAFHRANGDEAQALAAFEKATRCPLDLTFARRRMVQGSP